LWQIPAYSDNSATATTRFNINSAGYSKSLLRRNNLVYGSDSPCKINFFAGEHHSGSRYTCSDSRMRIPKFACIGRPSADVSRALGRMEMGEIEVTRGFSLSQITG